MSDTKLILKAKISSQLLVNLILSTALYTLLQPEVSIDIVTFTYPMDVVTASLLDIEPGDDDSGLHVTTPPLQSSFSTVSPCILLELYCDRRARWLNAIPGAEQRVEAESS